MCVSYNDNDSVMNGIHDYYNNLDHMSGTKRKLDLRRMMQIQYSTKNYFNKHIYFVHFQTYGVTKYRKYFVLR